MNEYCCRNGCGKVFYNTNNRHRHETAYCKHKKEMIEQLKINNKEYKKTIETMQETINNLESELLEVKTKFEKNSELIETKNKLHNVTVELALMTNKYIASLENTTTITTELVKSTTELAKSSNETTQITANASGKSMSAINCLTRYFANGPVLQHKEKEIIKSIEYVGTDKHTPEEFMINKYENYRLHEWIGDIILDTQTDTDNLEKQAMWVTDSARYSYIVRQCVEGVSKNEWFTDKSGVKVKELIIDPVTKTIDNMMNKHLHTLSGNAIDLYNATEEERNIVTEKQMFTCAIKKDIKDGTLSNNILKYITPKLNYDQKKIDLFITTQMDKGKNKEEQYGVYEKYKHFYPVGVKPEKKKKVIKEEVSDEETISVTKTIKRGRPK